MRPGGWRPRCAVQRGDTTLVPGSAGEVLVGSTTAFAGFDRTVTPTGVATLREAAGALVPELREVAPARTWAGLRPCSTIRRPIIAPVPGLPRVVLGTGHHKSGVLLAPITARLVRALLTGCEADVPLHPFVYRKH